MCKVLFVLGLAMLPRGSSAAHVSTSEPVKAIGAEAFEILLEVLVVLVVFGISTPFLARMRRRPNKNAGSASFGEQCGSNGGQWKPVKHQQQPARVNGLAPGRSASGASMKALSDLKETSSIPYFSPHCVTPPARQQAAAAHVSLADADHSWRRRGPVSKVEQLPPLPLAASIASVCGGHGHRLSQFIAVNQLEGTCARALRELPAIVAEWVMDQEFVVRSGSPSLTVLHTLKRSQEITEDFFDDYPTRADLAKRLSTFVALNRLDMRCARTLERLPEESLRRVMDHEFIVEVDCTKGTASAKVVGHIMRMCRS